MMCDGLHGRDNSRLLPVLLACAFCGLAFWHCHRAIMDVRWAPLFDSWRDTGQAEVILEGRYPADIVYADATLWYNPLTSAVVALAARVSGILPADADIRIAPYANLLVPVSFTLLAVCWFGRWAAVAALVFLLFGNPLQVGSAQSWSPWMFNVSTYSPWLWAPHFAQGFFYLAFAAYWWSFGKAAFRYHVLAGLLLGITFMTHTAPALVFGGTTSLVTLGAIIGAHGERAWSRRAGILVRYLALLATAFVTSLPYTYSILWNYRFHVVNTSPSQYTDPYYLLEVLPNFIRDHLSLSNAIALVGLLLLFRRPGKHLEKGLVAAWLLTASGFVVHSYLSKRFFWLPPQMMPPHHFVISLSGCKTLLFGYGIIEMARPAAKAAARLWARYRRSTADIVSVFELSGPLAAVLIVFAASYPSYRSWNELRGGLDHEGYPGEFRDLRATYEWILENTTPDDVVLSDQVLSCQLVMPTARKTVAIMSIFANPYLAEGTRAQDREAMLVAAKDNDTGRFEPLAQKYRVKYLLLKDPQACGLTSFREVFRSGPIAIHQAK